MLARVRKMDDARCTSVPAGCKAGSWLAKCSPRQGYPFHRTRLHIALGWISSAGVLSPCPPHSLSPLDGSPSHWLVASLSCGQWCPAVHQEGVWHPYHVTRYLLILIYAAKYTWLVQSSKISYRVCLALLITLEAVSDFKTSCRDDKGMRLALFSCRKRIFYSVTLFILLLEATPTVSQLPVKSGITKLLPSGGESTSQPCLRQLFLRPVTRSRDHSRCCHWHTEGYK